MFKSEVQKVLEKAQGKSTLKNTPTEFDNTTISTGQIYSRYEMGIISGTKEYKVIGFAAPELRGNEGELYADAPSVIVQKLNIPPAHKNDEYHILSVADVAFYIKNMEDK